MSVIPFDLIPSESIQKLKAVRLIKLLKLLKLGRVLRANRTLARWDTSMAISYARISYARIGWLELELRRAEGS